MASDDYLRAVTRYYDEAEIDYRLLWHLDSQMAMHYGWWDEGVKRLRQALRRENEVLAQRAGVTASDRVLDAGCGVGGSSIFLAKTTGAHVTGISLSEKQVESARRNAEQAGVGNKVGFECQDFTRTSFADASFDVVWAIESVCHAADKAAFTREAYRLLKPGGRLIVADGWLSNTKAGASPYIKRWLEGWSVRSLATMNRFEGYLSDAGFADVQGEDATRYVEPSVKRLHAAYYPGWLADRIMRLLRLRSEVHSGNVAAARYQYLAWRDGLWKYGVVLATKAPGPA